MYIYLQSIPPDRTHNPSLSVFCLPAKHIKTELFCSFLFRSPWLEPTSKTLQPGETMTLAFRLQRAPGGSDPLNTNITGPGPRTRNALLESIGEPVLHGVPGYVLSSEMRSAQLLVLPPAGAAVTQAITESVGAGDL